MLFMMIVIQFELSFLLYCGAILGFLLVVGPGLFYLRRYLTYEGGVLVRLGIIIFLASKFIELAAVA